MKKDTIFVNIASYKDPELRITVNALFKMAARPETLRVVVCQQNDPGNFISFPYENVELININKIDSQGVCWARRQVQDRYDDEEYFLQIDSHIVMAENWDLIIKDQLQRVRKQTANKVIMSSYPSAYFYKPDGNRKYNKRVYSQTVLRTNGPFRFVNGIGGPVNGFPEPLPTPYINAGLMFGHGSFNRDCLYDPDIYFEGEELLNTVKAYTHGYDLFNPSAHMGWHLYKLWNEPDKWKNLVHHSEEDDKHRPVRHWQRAEQASAKLIEILSGNLPDQLGTVRSLEDYEKYIGRPVLEKR